MELISFPKKKYNIIYADPPWHFSNWSGKGTVKAPINHYPTMKLKDICSLDIDKIADKNCILFIWSVDPLLNKVFDVIKSWNFTFKTVGFVWVKTNKNFNTKQNSFLPIDSFDSFWGLGYWTRANVELCILATKGKLKKNTNN